MTIKSFNERIQSLEAEIEKGLTHLSQVRSLRVRIAQLQSELGLNVFIAGACNVAKAPYYIRTELLSKKLNDQFECHQV